MTIVARQIEADEVKKAVLDMAKYVHQDFALAFGQRLLEGQFFGLVPLGVSEKQLLDFESGGLTIPGQEFFQKGQRIVQKLTLDQDFASILAGVVDIYPTSAIIGFDVISDQIKVIDPKNLDLKRMPFGILERTKNSQDSILDFINDFKSAWTTVLIAVRDPDHVKNVNDLSKSVILFAVGAYDGESFIYWKVD